MNTQRSNDLETIKKELEKEFPGDFALQQIHIARKILAKEAEEKGMNFIDYIQLQAKSLNIEKHKG